MKIYFVAGTDTEIGKTYTTCLLCKYFRKKGFKVGALKPVESGIESNPEPDYVKLAKASGDKEKKIYILSKPLAPMVASEIDGVKINLDKIINFFTNDVNATNYDYYFIEGAGGLLVPINEYMLYIDLIKQFNCEVILVARTNLGTVNHTLLSLEALEKRGIPIKGVILNEIIPTEKKMIEQNIYMIERFSSYKVIKVIPNGSKLNDIGEINGI